MAQPIVSLDIIANAAYRSTPKFDVRTPRATQAVNSARQSSEKENKYALVGLYYPELADLMPVGSDAATLPLPGEQWLKRYGLAANKLDSNSILRLIGFKHVKSFESSLKKPVGSTYAESLFCRFTQENGDEYNIIAKKPELQQAIESLNKLMDVYQKRIEWLTHGSRKLFGLVLERRVTILVDYRIQSVLEFEQFCLAFERFIKEQLSRTDRFNLIRCDEEALNCFAPDGVAATSDNIDAAIQWIRNWRKVASVPSDQTSASSRSHNVIGGLDKAANDPLTQAVYVCTNGISMESYKELLRNRVQQMRIPVHVSAFNCTNPAMLQYFCELCLASNSRFHAYRVTMQFSLYEPLPYSEDQRTAPVGKREYISGTFVQDGTVGELEKQVSSTRNDVISVFSENEKAKTMRKQIENIVTFLEERGTQRKPENESGQTNAESSLDEQPEEYLSSQAWLARHGIKARRLDFYDFLRNMVFKHSDGVLDQCFAPIKSRFELAMEQEREKDMLGSRARAESLDLSKKRPKSSACVDHSSRLVNAQYCCRLFAHIRWSNGELMHVQVSPELYRFYEERMLICMNGIERRLNWLKHNSRAVFGTILEESVYLLVDISESMQPHMQFLKDRIYLLLQEQIRHKQSFNIIAFNTDVQKWKPKLQPVTESSLQDAWQFVRGLEAYGTTNTLDALRAALLDRVPAEAFYLLTDGRPDIPKAVILEEIESYRFYRVRADLPAKKRPLPRVHCISFNCEDYEADMFLQELAKLTNGRFHAFHISPDARRRRIANHYPAGLRKEDGTLELVADRKSDVFEGDDVGFLEHELALGRTYLMRLQELRDQCAAKSDVSLRNRRERVEESRQLADNQQKIVSARRRDRLGNGNGKEKPVAGALNSHAKLMSKMRKRMTRNTDDDDLAVPPSVTVVSTQVTPSSDWMLPETRSFLEQARTPSAEWKRKLKKEQKLRALAASIATGSSDEDLETDQAQRPLLLDPLLARQVGELVSSERQIELDAEAKQKAKSKLKSKAKSKIPSIKKWLRRESLAAKQLNLHDILRPTFIMRTYRYVPILRKYIHAKVYDDSIPIGLDLDSMTLDVDTFQPSDKSDDEGSIAANRPDKDKAIHLINPLSINLTKYASDLEDFISRASTFLNRCVWAALTDEQRYSIVCPDQVPQRPESADQGAAVANEKIEGEAEAEETPGKSNEEPEAEENHVSQELVPKLMPLDAKARFKFAENREICLEYLEKNGWPVNKRRKIEKLEDEIKTAAKFLEQSREIQDACKEEIRKRKLKANASAADASKGKLHEAAASSAAVSKPSKKGQSASQELELENENGNDAASSQEDEDEDDGFDYRIEERVVARNGEDGLFYHAQIRRKNDNGTYQVDFTNPNLVVADRTQTLRKKFILPAEGTKNYKKLTARMKTSDFAPGTHVLVRALNSETCEFCYVPGIFSGLIKEKRVDTELDNESPEKSSTADKLNMKCEVALYNSQPCRARLKNLTVIKPAVYESSRRLLAEIERQQKQKTKSSKREKTTKSSHA